MAASHPRALPLVVVAQVAAEPEAVIVMVVRGRPTLAQVAAEPERSAIQVAMVVPALSL